MEETQALRERILEALMHIRCAPAGTESELHAQAAQALLDAGIAAEHEAVLGPRCRIDFLAGGVGIEIKKSRPQPAALRRQLARYAQCEAIEELIVVAPRGVNLPASIGGRRVTMLALERLWGVSLP